MSHPSFNSLNSAVQQLKEVLINSQGEEHETLVLLGQMEEHLAKMSGKYKGNGSLKTTDSVIQASVTPAQVIS